MMDVDIDLASSSVAIPRLRHRGNQQGPHTIEVDESDKWPKIIIQNTGALHPIYLHGHDFYILAQPFDPYNPAKEELNTKNPPRRDVADLAISGHLVLGVELDNPGVWLMRCYVGSMPPLG